MNATELATLPLDERLRAMETLWDSICRDAGDGLVAPVWHGAVLDERARRLDAGEESVSDWATARRRLRAQTGDA